ncbi:hypothetical protein J6590_024605 [Homalodisca vitripennis]|nr:hypothetical protein J6590_024605 [Homalodisca vitripennis]
MYPCKNTVTGCIMMLKLDDKQEHEEGCGFRHYACIVNTCHWKGYKPELVVHLQSNHPDKLISGSSKLPKWGLWTMLSSYSLEKIVFWDASKLGSLNNVMFDGLIRGAARVFEYTRMSGIYTKLNKIPFGEESSGYIIPMDMWFGYPSPESRPSLYPPAPPFPHPLSTCKIHNPIRKASRCSGFVGDSQNCSALSICSFTTSRCLFQASETIFRVARAKSHELDSSPSHQAAIPSAPVNCAQSVRTSIVMLQDYWLEAAFNTTNSTLEGNLLITLNQIVNKFVMLVVCGSDRSSTASSTNNIMACRGGMEVQVPLTVQVGGAMYISHHWIQSAHNEVFNVIFHVDLFKKMMKGCVIYIGSPDKAEKFTYQFELKQRFPPFRSQVFSRRTHADTVKPGQSLCLTSDFSFNIEQASIYRSENSTALNTVPIFITILQEE